MFMYIHSIFYYKLFLYLNLFLSVRFDSLSFSFTSLSLLTTSGSVTFNLCPSVIFDCLSCSFTSNKGYRCIWTRETIQHYTSTQIKVNEQLVVRKDMDVNEIRVITKLPNSEQSYKGKVKINRQNQSTTGKLWETVRDYPTLHLGTH
jgi:hypothetical protein